MYKMCYIPTDIFYSATNKTVLEEKLSVWGILRNNIPVQYTLWEI